jgi:hypothetical protein
LEKKELIENSLAQMLMIFKRKYGKPIWKFCPFVPENGYSEVAVNLKWHFEKLTIRECNKGGAA